MKRSEATRYARWSAILAFAIVLLTAGVYFRRVWVAHVEKSKAPPAPPQDVERQSSGLTFSKREGVNTIFTVQASKSTDFRGQDASLLEEVTVTVFGKSGDRNDVIHTKSCQYSKTDGAIQCNGDVLMELQSAADAKRAKEDPSAPSGLVRIETRGVTFERATGRAQTVQPVTFSFPNGSGEGLGADYSSEEGHLRLIRNVHLKLRPPSESAKSSKVKPPRVTPEVALTGNSLEFDRNSRIILLHGPVTADTTAQQLTSGELSLLLDEKFRAQTLFATAGSAQQEPRVSMHGANGESVLTANKITTQFAPEGWVREVQAEGNVHGKSPSGTLQADTGEMEMWPKVNQARLLTVRGNVNAIARDEKSGTQRHLSTTALSLAFSGGKQGEPSRVQHAETLDRGTLDWTDSAAARSKLSGDKLALDFGALGKARQLTATGAVEMERQVEGSPLQTASAANGVVQLDPTGGWSQITLHENVRMNEGERNAQSTQAVFVKADQSAVLTGQAMVRDTTSETHAAKIRFYQNTGDVEAEGNVRSTDLSAKGSAVQLSAAPANISSDHLKANSKSGRALYTGHARLWQGSSVLQSDSIELQRPSRTLNATGNVRAVFLQAPQGSQGEKQVNASISSSKPPNVWHISAGTLAYWDSENHAHLEKNVLVQSPDEKIHSSALELYFTRGGTECNSGATVSGAVGSAQISRAVAIGSVVVEQGERRGTADRGTYTAADQKFVLSGGNPTLYDSTEGTTTGRELTFNMADDTIVVDSGNGSRTLTKHRVQK